MTTYKPVKKSLSNNIYKYYFTNSSQERLSWKDVLELLEDKDQNFFPVFQLALHDANSNSFPYRWNCSPVSKTGLDKSFEFVVKKESALENISPNYSAFQTPIDQSNNPEVTSFLNLDKTSTLVIPMPVSGLDFADISRFTKNASLQQQELFWQEVANQLTKEINKGGKTKWLNTHGTGVYHLHVRIDPSPKYYFFADYENPNYTPIPIPSTPKEKLLANLDKLCLNPNGYLANNQHLKTDGAEEEYQEYYNHHGLSQWKNRYLKITIGSKEIDLENFNDASSDFFEVKRELIKKIKEEIEQNPSQWKIEKGKNENYSGDFNWVIKHQKSGRRYWKIGFFTMREPNSENYWAQIENALKNSPNQQPETETKKWYNPLDYPLPWTLAVAFSVLLIVMIFQKRTKKRF